MKTRTAQTIALVAAAFVAGWFVRGAREADAPPAIPPVAARPSPPTPPAPSPRRHEEPVEWMSPDEMLRGTAPFPSGDTVEGRCALRDGRPAAGARVRAWDTDRLRRGEAAEIGRERRADDDGRFVVGDCTRGHQVVVYATLPGFQTASAVLKIEDERTEATVTFGEGGVLTGTVSDAAGAPVADAQVRLRPRGRAEHTRDSGDWRLWTEPDIWDWYPATARTDAEGRYRFEGAPLPRNGVPQPRTPVAEIAGRWWRGDDAAFDADGRELVRDIRAGGAPWTDETFDPPPPRTVAPRRVRGIVTDADGAPVRGARVAYIASDGPRNFTWTAVSSGGDGRFEADLGSDNAHGGTIEVRVSARGFRRWRGAPEKGDTVARLEKEDHPPIPGRVRGIATDSAGKPIAGVIDVHGMDESLGMLKQRTIADAGGAFVLDGVATGTWQFFLDWDDDRADATVTEGGDAWTELRTSREAASFVPRPWTPDAAQERDETERKVQALAIARHELEVAGEPTEPVDGKLFPLHDRLEALDDARRASSPARSVVVTGLPKDAGVVVRAEAGGHTWRAAAAGGVATFAALSPEPWTFVLERPGADDVEQETEIVAGDGPQTLEWTKR